MSPDCGLLIDALLAEPAAGEAYWRRWRAEVDLDRMSEDCVRLLPVLATRYPAWLAADPAKNLILGLTKRAWTRNQLLLRSLTGLLASLTRAGVREPAIAGPAAWALLYQSEKSFRPVFFFELLIRREEALRTAGALIALGWNLAPSQVLPRPEEFDYTEAIWFRNEAGEGLRLTWRLFPAPGDRAAEWEILPPLETIEFQNTTIPVPSRDVMLACALAGRRDGDHLDWRCDAITVLRGGAVDWTRVSQCIQFSPAARTRLLQLARETAAPIPPGLRRRPPRLWFQWNLVQADYRRDRSLRGEPASLRGFFRFLCERWQTPAWQAPFLGLFYLLRYAFSESARR